MLDPTLLRANPAELAQRLLATRGHVLDVAALESLESTRKQLQTPEAAKAVADSGVAPDLDRAARALPAVQLTAFASHLRQAALGPDSAKRLAELAGSKAES